MIDNSLEIVRLWGRMIQAMSKLCVGEGFKSLDDGRTRSVCRNPNKSQHEKQRTFINSGGASLMRKNCFLLKRPSGFERRSGEDATYGGDWYCGTFITYHYATYVPHTLLHRPSRCRPWFNLAVPLPLRNKSLSLNDLFRYIVSFSIVNQIAGFFPLPLIDGYNILFIRIYSVYNTCCTFKYIFKYVYIHRFLQ